MSAETPDVATSTCAVCGDPIEWLGTVWLHIPAAPGDEFDHLACAELWSSAEPAPLCGAPPKPEAAGALKAILAAAERLPKNYCFHVAQEDGPFFCQARESAHTDDTSCHPFVSLATLLGSVAELAGARATQLGSNAATALKATGLLPTELAEDVAALAKERDQLRESCDMVSTQLAAAKEQLAKGARLWDEFKRNHECYKSLAEHDIDGLRREKDLAESTLRSAGWTHKSGAEAWKPPLGPSPSPLFATIDQLRAELAEVTQQRDSHLGVCRSISRIVDEVYPSEPDTLEKKVRWVRDRLTDLAGSRPLSSPAESYRLLEPTTSRRLERS